MKEETKQVLWVSAAGLAVLGLVWLWLNNRATTSPNSSGYALNLPGGSSASPVTFTPAAFEVSPVSGSSANNPGSTVVFNFNPPGAPGSADAVTPACNCPTSGAVSYGSLDDAAAALAPLIDGVWQQVLAGASTVNQYTVAQYGGSNPVQTYLNEQKAQRAAIYNAADNLWSSAELG